MAVRSYGQYCGVARALDLVGERWALLVVRELILGPKRFTDLRRGLPGIGTNILASRLKELELAGVVERRTLPPPAASSVYELSEYGRELEPILLSLGRWGGQTLGLRTEEQAMRSEWLGVALKAYFRPKVAGSLRARIELRLPDGVYRMRIERGSLEVERAAADGADLTITTDEETLIGFLAGARVARSALAPEGDRALLARLPELFSFSLS
jgi:DNA-binding HxlR family transcriptional regulator